MSIAETPTSKSGDLQRSLFTSVSSVGSDGEQDAFESTSSDSSDASLGDFFSDKKWNFSGSSLQGMGQIPGPVLPPGRSYSVDLTSSQPPLMSRPLQTRVSVSGPVHRECLPCRSCDHTLLHHCGLSVVMEVFLIRELLLLLEDT